MNMPDINMRIKLLIDFYCNGNVNQFVKNLSGISQQKLNRLFNIDIRTKKYPLATTDVIVAIVEMYVEINPEWLLLGKGSMLRENWLCNNTDTILESEKNISNRIKRVCVEFFGRCEQNEIAGLAKLIDFNSIELVSILENRQPCPIYVLDRIHKKYPQINWEWLYLGMGKMNSPILGTMVVDNKTKRSIPAIKDDWPVIKAYDISSTGILKDELRDNVTLRTLYPLGDFIFYLENDTAQPFAEPDDCLICQIKNTNGPFYPFVKYLIVLKGKVVIGYLTKSWENEQYFIIKPINENYIPIEVLISDILFLALIVAKISSLKQKTL